MAPAATGTVRRGAVDIAWERFGGGSPALLFVGVDPIVESQMWKGQVPWLARRHTVITFDPPGNGRSTRTTDPRAYGDGEYLAAALAVLDANGVEHAVVAGVCQGAGVALLLAAEHPERVDGVVAINPGLVLSPAHAHRRRLPGRTFDDVIDEPEGWEKENREHWRRDWADYAHFFFGQLLPEPHSTKQHDDCVGWAAGTTGEQMLAYCFCDPPTPRDDEEYATDVCRRVRCPVLVINGDRDMCQPSERSRRVAELTGGELAVIEGAGHLPHARDPVRVNLEIAGFLRRLALGEAARAVR
jgi:pimeloyl-ACP methyl ester carboxylesterase